MSLWHNRYPSRHFYASHTRLPAMGGLGRLARPCLPATAALLVCGLLAPCRGTAPSATPGKQPANSQSNTSDAGTQAATMGGVKTGGAHAATYDEQRRPITAGGFVKNGPVIFKDIAKQAGMTIWQHGWVRRTSASSSRRSAPALGTAFIDYDNDGWKDLLVANGHVRPAVDHHPWGPPGRSGRLLFDNIGGKKFELVPAVEGTALAHTYVGRGMAVGDLFNDGKMDVVINVMDGPPALLLDVSPDKRNWIDIKLVGRPKSPRDAIGATVYLTANHMRQRGDVISGGSYASTNDPRLHFGLGDATIIDDVEVHWPSGAKERFHIPKIDRIVTLAECYGTKF